MIYLVGFMGCGKTTIGKLLAKSMCLPFTDLDKCFQEHHKMSINDFFQNHSEEQFRIAEEVILNNLLGHQVVATGGGLPVYKNNMEWMNHSGVTIYLKCSAVLLHNRLIKEKEHRPIIKEIIDSDLLKFITDLLAKRESYYIQAKYTIDTDNMSTDDILREIHSLLLPR